MNIQDSILNIQDTILYIQDSILNIQDKKYLQPCPLRGPVICRLYLCIVHCNKVRKPVKGKYLLLCMNSIMYLLLTCYTLIMFLKVLSHLILKIKSVMKYLKGDLEIFQNFHEFLNVLK